MALINKEGDLPNARELKLVEEGAWILQNGKRVGKEGRGGEIAGVGKGKR